VDGRFIAAVTGDDERNMKFPAHNDAIARAHIEPPMAPVVSSGSRVTVRSPIT